MSLLTDKLPDCVCVSGEAYPVRTDFRTWLRFGELMRIPDGKERIVRIFDLCFPDKTPHAPWEAMKALAAFYSMQTAKEAKKAKTPKKQPESGATLDFEIDSGLIYAAFIQCYGIDLLTAGYMHWYIFLTLLRSLPEECRLCRVLSLRAMNLSEISVPDLRRRYAELKEACALPDRRTEEEKQKDLDETIAQGFFS